MDLAVTLRGWHVESRSIGGANLAMAWPSHMRDGPMYLHLSKRKGILSVSVHTEKRVILFG